MISLRKLIDTDSVVKLHLIKNWSFRQFFLARSLWLISLGCDGLMAAVVLGGAMRYFWLAGTAAEGATGEIRPQGMIAWRLPRGAECFEQPTSLDWCCSHWEDLGCWPQGPFKFTSLSIFRVGTGSEWIVQSHLCRSTTSNCLSLERRNVVCS